MTKPDLGLKRRCMTCGAKFYDLNRSPITCPKCGTPFQAAPLTALQPPPRCAHGMKKSLEAEAARYRVRFAGGRRGQCRHGGCVYRRHRSWGRRLDDKFLEEEEEGEDDISGLIQGDLNDDEAELARELMATRILMQADRQQPMCFTIYGVVACSLRHALHQVDAATGESSSSPSSRRDRIKLKMPRTARVTSCVSRPVFPCPVRSSCDRGRWLHAH